MADIRLADRVFAPHYAAPLPMVAVRDVAVHETPGGPSVIANLAAGDGFEVLELAGDTAWGVATDNGLVGYVDADALVRT